jgi:hypothetical protein
MTCCEFDSALDPHPAVLKVTYVTHPDHEIGRKYACREHLFPLLKAAIAESSSSDTVLVEPC